MTWKRIGIGIGIGIVVAAPVGFFVWRSTRPPFSFMQRLKLMETRIAKPFHMEIYRGPGRFQITKSTAEPELRREGWTIKSSTVSDENHNTVIWTTPDHRFLQLTDLIFERKNGKWQVESKGRVEVVIYTPLPSLTATEKEQLWPRKR